MRTITNVPKKDEARIIGTWDAGSNRIIVHANGATIKDFGCISQSSLAAEIGYAIEDARDIGYQHALRDIREMLGIKTI